MRQITKLEYVPKGLEEIKDYYGDPDPNEDGVFDTEFRKNLRVFNFPFPLIIGWKEGEYRAGDSYTLVRRALMHEKIGLAVVDALFEIGQRKGGSYLNQNRLNLWWGAFNFRLKRGYNSLSTHSWGIAIDINKHRGELGVVPTMPDFIVEAFEKRGFVWGGRWGRPDGMHFQACKGY